MTSLRPWVIFLLATAVAAAPLFARVCVLDCAARASRGATFTSDLENGACGEHGEHSRQPGGGKRNCPGADHGKGMTISTASKSVPLSLPALSSTLTVWDASDPDRLSIEICGCSVDQVPRAPSAPLRL